MYKITVNSTGKYKNVKLGARYCLRKKTAKHLIDIFTDTQCDITVEKFIKLTNDVFCWSDWDEDDKIFEYFVDKEYMKNE